MVRDVGGRELYAWRRDGDLAGAITRSTVTTVRANVQTLPGIETPQTVGEVEVEVRSLESSPDAPAARGRFASVERGQLRNALIMAGVLGGVVLLGGEPGIGKTCLATVLVDDAAGRGMPVWWGRGWEDATTPAYWPWNAALRGWVDRAGIAVPELLRYARRARCGRPGRLASVRGWIDGGIARRNPFGGLVDQLLDLFGHCQSWSALRRS